MKYAIRCILFISLGFPLYSQNQVLLLDGIDDYIDLPNPIIDTDKFTIEAWVKLNGPGGGIETQSAIFEQREDATGCNHSTVVFVAESWSYERYESLAIRTDIECYVSCRAESPPYGDWNHYACVVSEDVIYIYLNGLLRNTVEYEHEGSFSTNIDHVSLGKHTHDWSGFGFLNGAMDEVRIWGSPMSQYKILSLMNTPSLTGEEGDLLAYWNFNDSTATDITGHGHDGIITSGATCTTDSIPRPCPGVVGDLNQDGYLSISDIQILIEYILEGTEPIFDLECVDYNGDGYINIGEVILLTDFLLNG